MALQINKTLTLQTIVVPTGTLLISALHLPAPILGKNENNQWDNTITRVITYDIYAFASKTEYLKNPTLPLIGLTDIPTGYTRQLTTDDYEALMQKGEIAELWLQEYINEQLGGNYTTIINPYIK